MKRYVCVYMYTNNTSLHSIFIFILHRLKVVSHNNWFTDHKIVPRFVCKNIIKLCKALQAVIRCISSPTNTVVKGWSIGLYSTEKLQNHHIDVKAMSYDSFNDAKHFKLSQSILLYMFHAIFPLKFYWSFIKCKTNITTYPKIEEHYLRRTESFEIKCSFLQFYIEIFKKEYVFV